jgi:choline transport protein
MNYVSVVYAVVAALVAVDYFVRGKKSFRGASERHGDIHGGGEEKGSQGDENLEAREDVKLGEKVVSQT